MVTKLVVTKLVVTKVNRSALVHPYPERVGIPAYTLCVRYKRVRGNKRARDYWLAPETIRAFGCCIVLLRRVRSGRVGADLTLRLAARELRRQLEAEYRDRGIDPLSVLAESGLRGQRPAPMPDLRAPGPVVD